MTDEISDEEFEAIAKRVAAATPGPWISYFEGRDHTSGDSFIRTPVHDLYISSDNYIGGEGHFLADQDFVAHARQDIPRLLEEVRRLRLLNRSKCSPGSSPRAGA
jgi:hypothetical protein